MCPLHLFNNEAISSLPKDVVVQWLVTLNQKLRILLIETVKRILLIETVGIWTTPEASQVISPPPVVQGWRLVFRALDKQQPTPFPTPSCLGSDPPPSEKEALTPSSNPFDSRLMQTPQVQMPVLTNLVHCWAGEVLNIENRIENWAILPGSNYNNNYYSIRVSNQTRWHLSDI